jgi:glycosyltransferase involved in cell wall biosynthesis
MSSPDTIQQFQADYRDGRYFRDLVNTPAPHRLREPPVLIHHISNSGLAPRLTIVTPTFNCASTIQSYVEATAAAVSLPFDWILVDDGSEDGTPEMAVAALNALACPLLARATIVRNPAPVFETACDNIGFRLAETEVIVEIQSDIQVREPGFDALMIATLDLHPRPAAVSGRCGHSFLGLRGPLARALFGFGRNDGVGLYGSRIDTPELVESLRGRRFRCETVPRGPWALRKSDLARLGSLDERFFFLGNDDHDFHRRVYVSDRRRPVYLPMKLYAPLQAGATRRPRSGANAEIFRMLKHEKRGSPAFREFLSAQRRWAQPEEIP